MTKQFPPANEFVVPISVQLFESQALQLRKYLNLHYLGDVDANEMNENGKMVSKYPDEETLEYKTAIEYSHCYFKFHVRLVYDTTGKPTLELLK